MVSAGEAGVRHEPNVGTHDEGAERVDQPSSEAHFIMPGSTQRLNHEAEAGAGFGKEPCTKERCVAGRLDDDLRKGIVLPPGSS